MSKLTHLDAQGQAHMVDVGNKPITARSATAQAFVRLGAEALIEVQQSQAAKGDVLATARIAGIMAAKRVPELIPLAHPILLSKISLALQLEDNGIRITATVSNTGQTGVEIEAMTAASVASLTVYDMLKAVERGIEIQQVRLLHKEGGASGVFQAKD